MKKQMIQLVWSISIIFFILGCSNQTFQSEEPVVKGISTDHQEESELDPKIPEPEPEKEIVTTATIAAVGDILIHSTLFKDAFDGETYDFTPMFEPVKDMLQHADITFANQETMIGGPEIGFSGYPSFNSPFEVGDALYDAGVDIVSLANNHTLDRGEKAIINAINHWNSIGMTYTGAYESFEDKEEIRTIEANDITFSFLAYTYGTNGIPIPDGKEYLVNVIEIETMIEEIKEAKEQSDVVVLSLHFGDEYQPYPNDMQKTIATEAANAGASIIFGHHPHVLQPMEWIETEDGEKAYVVYSLGNFLAGQEGVEREIGGIARLEVVKTVLGEERTIELKDPRFIPTYASKQNWRNYRIYPLEEVQDSLLYEAAGHYEKTKEHMKQWMPELQFHFD
ncbi:CapA family protein [Alkalihalobacterium bogoriense]|uniref:CapA family protein n=1 Tax=Alkalihalobacterium bogoriense TaxID=246272 RepID=UPI00047C4F33|nr:CapA family protein [Alkalihalobacterium bogoriense]